MKVRFYYFLELSTFLNFLYNKLAELTKVEEQMVRSMRQEIYLSYLDYETSDRVIWVRDWPGMVVLCVSQIYWSLEVQNCLVGRGIFAMESLYEKLKSQILKLVDLVRGL